MTTKLIVGPDHTLLCPICDIEFLTEPMKYRVTVLARHPKGEVQCPWAGYVFRADLTSGLAERENRVQ